MALEKLKSLFTSKPAQPKAVVNDLNRFYLAAAVKHTKELSFVYTLACKKNERGDVVVFDTITDVATYLRRRDADAVYATYQEMIKIQKAHAGVKAAHNVHADLIASFLENTK